MRLSTKPSSGRILLALVMVVGGVLVGAAFVGAPNMARIAEQGIGWMVRRAIDEPVEGLFFVAEPFLALAQFGAAWALLTGRAGRGAVMVAVGFACLVVLGGGLLLILGAASYAAGGGH